MTTLEGLAHALPNDEVSYNEQEDASQVNIIKRKSMKSRPGAMKRREKVDKVERERFAKNVAQMASAQDGGTTPAPYTERWKALRGFISQTMERKPESKTAGR